MAEYYKVKVFIRPGISRRNVFNCHLRWDAEIDLE